MTATTSSWRRPLGDLAPCCETGMGLRGPGADGQDGAGGAPVVEVLDVVLDVLRLPFSVHGGGCKGVMQMVAFVFPNWVAVMFFVVVCAGSMSVVDRRCR